VLVLFSCQSCLHHPYSGALHAERGCKLHPGAQSVRCACSAVQEVRSADEQAVACGGAAWWSLHQRMCILLQPSKLGAAHSTSSDEFGCTARRPVSCQVQSGVQSGLQAGQHGPPWACGLQPTEGVTVRARSHVAAGSSVGVVHGICRRGRGRWHGTNRQEVHMKCGTATHPATPRSGAVVNNAMKGRNAYNSLMAGQPGPQRLLYFQAHRPGGATGSPVGLALELAAEALGVS
jgi:hypothetical protein